jgi:hypothetical protein
MPHARLTDPETSHEAADSVRNLTLTKKAIVSIFEKHNSLSDYHLQIAYRGLVSGGDAPKASESGIRSRRAELVDEGILEDSGYRIALESGRSAILWKLAK